MKLFKKPWNNFGVGFKAMGSGLHNLDLLRGGNRGRAIEVGPSQLIEIG
jgi:hypothetical protein